ncbi:MAG: hypothetical protein Q7R83_04685 [bacterium]|nr:hypothetical protein [bacterium]
MQRLNRRKVCADGSKLAGDVAQLNIAAVAAAFDDVFFLVVVVVVVGGVRYLVLVAI